MELDPATLSAREVYAWMTSLLVPRPIAWTGTRSASGLDNLAPFSYFMGVSSRPPALAISVSRGPKGALKDSARNILETGVFTVSIVCSSQAEAMNASSAAYPPEVSEFSAVGLTPVEGARIAAPRPAEAKVGLECRLWQSLDLGSTHLFVGEILLFHVDPSVLGPEGLVDAAALDPLARLGGSQYATLGRIFSLPRPTGGG